MGTYYDQIMEDSPSCFVPIFNRLWMEEIESHKMPYSNAAQILEGNRLRPRLMAWGYYLNTPIINHEYIADFTICIELVHKASILLDDLIDDDVARHGVISFHTQYSNEEAILYAIFLLNRSIELMREKDLLFGFTNTSLLLKIIASMSKGGLLEVQDKIDFNIHTVNEIIDLQTTILIKNSFILGYQLSSVEPDKVPEDIQKIGQFCGYCFQLLNDIEPFLAPDKNKKYKGNHNCDFDKNRKNIIIAYLFGSCTKQERCQLTNGVDFEYIDQLINKYKIIDSLLEEIDSKTISIKNSIQYLKKTKSDGECFDDFVLFMTNMFSICYKKCGLTFEKDFFSD